MNSNEESLKRIEAVTDELAKSIVNVVERSVRTCLNCDHFDETNEICNFYGGRPPAKVIAFGCDSYVDKVPF